MPEGRTLWAHSGPLDQAALGQLRSHLAASLDQLVQSGAGMMCQQLPVAPNRVRVHTHAALHLALEPPDHPAANTVRLPEQTLAVQLH